MAPIIVPRLSPIAVKVSKTSSTKITSRIRSMASSAAQKSQWLVILPDQENSREARLAVRPDHLKNLTPKVDSGFWQLGGATLAAPAQEGKPLEFTGSVMLAFAASKEEVLDELRKDVYFTSGVWDFEKITVYPMKTAFMKPA